MSRLGPASALFVLSALGLSGCQFAPRNRLATVESQNRALTEQTRAQLAQLENYKVHNRKLEDQLRAAEEELALKTPRSNRRLAGLHGIEGVALPGELRDRLVALSDRYPGLDFDPLTGISKLDTDILFDTAAAEVRPESQRLLRELADAFQSPTAEQLRLMVVGHTDDRRIAKQPTRERYPNNWHLSAARALAVADFLREAGIADPRLGVAGFGSSQPVAENDSDENRRLNRRVEVFILGPETPMVGWVDEGTKRY